MNNASHSLHKFHRLAKQIWRGVPYLQKEVTRALSVHTNCVLTTPQSYYVIFGSRCNAACIFCPQDRLGGPMLSREVMLRIVREARDLSGRGFNILFSGGEPLVYPHLQEVLELAHRLRVNFGFTTNGYLLTKANMAHLLACDPFNINVSLESVNPAVNELLRPRKNGTQETLEGIENIIAEKRRTGSRVSVIVKTTIMDQNYRTLPELLRFFSRYSEIQVSLQPYFGPLDSGFWIKNVDEFERVVAELKPIRKSGVSLQVDNQTLDGFVQYFRNPRNSQSIDQIDLDRKGRGCDIGYRSLAILSDGSVELCDLLKCRIGNVCQQTLSEIYYGENARSQRRRIACCNIDCQRTCQRPIRLSTKVRAFLRMG